MKSFNFLFLALFALTFLACGSDSTDQSKTPDTSTTDGTQVVVPGETGAPVNMSGDVKLNPAHGEPGHRCDIAVGAPLDGTPAPAAQSTSPVIQTEAAPAATSPVQAQPVAEGMNPPHGQPGHRCDIAVGAPLDSKPKQ